MTIVPAVVVDTVPVIVVPIACTVYRRRDGSCPLHPGLIKQDLGVYPWGSTLHSY